jgi:hypothetical protein
MLAWVKVLTLGFRPYIYHATRTRSVPNPVIPGSFSDKMLWRKIFDRNPAFVAMSDKLQARALARQRCPDIRLPDIVWESESAEDFPFDSIELPVVVKVNNGSGWNYFLRDRNPDERRKLNWFLHTMRRHRSYGRTKGEWAYRPIERRFYAERELVDSNGLPPDEYKLFFSNGRHTQMRVAHDRWGNRAMVNFSPDLQVIPVEETRWRRDYVPRDWHLVDEIISTCGKLAGDLDFVRVDVYVFDGNIYFSEFTLYPGSGTAGSAAAAAKEMIAGWEVSQSYYFRKPLSWFRRRYLQWLE